MDQGRERWAAWSEPGKECLAAGKRGCCRYVAESVAAALELDIVNHGAPVAYRLDRARCHDTPVVRQVLDRQSILALHGPAHHPGYYGQLERQNREHRAWLDALGTVTAAGSRRPWSP